MSRRTHRQTIGPPGLAALAALALFVGPGMGPGAAEDAAPLRVAWTRDLGDAGLDHDLRGLAVDGDALVVAATAYTGRDARLVLWRLDLGGRPDRSSSWPEAAPGKGFDGVGARPSGLAVGPDGAILVLARARGVVWLLRIAREGTLSLAEVVGELAGGRDLGRLVALPDGGALLLGHARSDAYAVRVGPDAAPRWDRVDDRGRQERYTDAAPLLDGGALLVGNSGDYDHLGRGPSSVFVTVVDATGARGAGTRFDGRGGRLVASPDGYAVVYDRATTDAHEIVLRRLDRALALRGETRLLAVHDDPLTGPGARAPFADFVPAAAPRAGLVVAGSWRGRPYLLRTDAAGAVRGTLHADATSMALAPEVVRRGDTVVAAYPVLVRDAGGRARTRIRILALDLRAGR